MKDYKHIAERRYARTRRIAGWKEAFPIFAAVTMLILWTGMNV